MGHNGGRWVSKGSWPGWDEMKTSECGFLATFGCFEILCASDSAAL